MYSYTLLVIYVCYTVQAQFGGCFTNSVCTASLSGPTSAEDCCINSAGTYISIGGQCLQCIGEMTDIPFTLTCSVMNIIKPYIYSQNYGLVEYNYNYIMTQSRENQSLYIFQSRSKACNSFIE